MDWIKRAEHGALGEARARAFLLDRFWVLERSIDKDGADFLIQRRLTEANFLSSTPPRLGVIQVKFLQDQGTSIRLPRQHVVDDKNEPFAEFFLLAFTGEGDSQKQFLLDSREIVAEGDEYQDESGRNFLRIAGTKVVKSERYLVTSNARALGRIERALETADFRRNRHFLNVGFFELFEPKIEHLDHDYTLPLYLQNGPLDRSFFKLKDKLRYVTYEIEDVLSAINDIVKSTDPVAAYLTYEKKISDHVDRNGNVSFDIEPLCNEDFFSAALQHKKRLERLRGAGLEAAFFDLMKEFQESVTNFVLAEEPWKGHLLLGVTVRYDPRTLRNVHIRSVLRDRGGQKLYPRLVVSKPGLQRLRVDPKCLVERCVHLGHGTDTREIVRDHVWHLQEDLQEGIEAKLFPEKEDA